MRPLLVHHLSSNPWIYIPLDVGWLRISPYHGGACLVNSDELKAIENGMQGVGWHLVKVLE